ncbi:YIP1 family protein [Paenibacillus alkalitolerans]|uniref:YIP1 family protein n=1 Tax=Paenibacillus alkalitolerans TaxID=2799335 RepID=UPI0018F724F8|nr:YIP1 family protein [Paenibacillus alkalitolerans]
MKCKLLAPVMVIVILFLMPIHAFAEDIPYNGYTYDYYDKGQPAPIGYEPLSVINATTLGVSNFKNPKDMFLDKDGKLYVLDSGNHRIVVIDPKNNKLLAVIDAFTTPNGETALKEPTGIFVSQDGHIYIADSGNQRVLKIDHKGFVLKTYTKPETSSYDNKVEFKPIKVVVDSSKNVYVLVDGLYDGAVVFVDDGTFTGFYGSNKVEMTLTKLADSFWKRLLSKEQRQKMDRSVPVAYSNFDIDSRDFVYTVSKDVSSIFEKARKINPSGVGLWERIKDKKPKFGDLEFAVIDGKVEESLFTDIDVDDDGFINMLDSAKRRIFQYDQSGTLLFVVGGNSDQLGTFLEPAAIESDGNDILVLDTKRGNITVFRLTEFGRSVHMAIKLYEDGQYKEAEQPWKDVLKRNSLYEAAYVGLGKASVKTAEYKAAMEYFKLGNDRPEYSKAFQMYRKDVIRSNFLFIVLGIAFACGICYLTVKKDIFRLRKVLKPYNYHFQVLLHPFDAMNEIVQNKAYSVRFSAFILFVWIVVKSMSFFYTGFIFNFNSTEDFNVLVILAGTVGIFALWTISNWSVCTLVDGKGTYKAIWVASTYALIPYLITQVVILIGSNVLVAEEGIFLTWISYIGLAYSILIMVSAMLHIHDFSFKETIGSIAGTIAGIAIMIFLLFMAFVLYQKVFEIFVTIFNEVTLRQ